MNWQFYLKLIRTWLASGAAQTPMQACEMAIKTLAGLAHVDLNGPMGQLVFSILEGVIIGPQNYPAFTTPEGVRHTEGPAVTPEHAVAIALAAAAQHDPSIIPAPTPPPVTKGKERQG